MSSDPSRLHVLLLNTGLQQKDNPLFQVIHDLIGSVVSVNKSVTSILGGGSGGSSVTNITNIQQIIGIPGEDGEAGLDGLPGPIGLTGLTGLSGPQGLDGEVDESIFIPARSIRDLTTPFNNGDVIVAGPSGGIIKCPDLTYVPANANFGFGVTPPDTQYKVIIAGIQGSSVSALALRENAGSAPTTFDSRVLAITDEAFTHQFFTINLSSTVVQLSAGTVTSALDLRTNLSAPLTLGTANTIRWTLYGTGGFSNTGSDPGATNVAITGTLAVTGNITGTLATAAQPNITSVGTLQSPVFVTPTLGVAVGTSLALTGQLSTGTGLQPTTQLYVFYPITTVSATNYYGIFVNTSYSPAANSSGTMYAINGSDTITPTGTATVTNTQIGVVGIVSLNGTGSGLVSDVRGFNCAVSLTSSNPVTSAYGNFIRWGSSGSGNVTVAYGVYLNSYNSGTGTIALNAGLLALTPTGGGVITNNYGILINKQGAAGIVNAYGINVLEVTGASSTNVSFCIGTAPTAVTYSFYNASTVASLFKGPIYSTVAEADLSYTVNAPVTGATVTMSAGQQRLIINPLATLALLTVTLPSSPVDGQLAGVSFTQIITGLTINAPGGATVIGPPVSAAVNSEFRFIYQASSTSWFPAA